MLEYKQQTKLRVPSSCFKDGICSSIYQFLYSWLNLVAEPSECNALLTPWYSNCQLTLFPKYSTLQCRPTWRPHLAVCITIVERRSNTIHQVLLPWRCAVRSENKPIQSEGPYMQNSHLFMQNQNYIHEHMKSTLNSVNALSKENTGAIFDIRGRWFTHWY
jgi:hypothetical protein